MFASMFQTFALFFTFIFVAIGVVTGCALTIWAAIDFFDIKPPYTRKDPQVLGMIFAGAICGGAINYSLEWPVAGYVFVAECCLGGIVMLGFTLWTVSFDLLDRFFRAAKIKGR